MTNNRIDIKLERALIINGKASQVVVPIYAPPGFLEEWERLEKLYFDDRK